MKLRNSYLKITIILFAITSHSSHANTAFRADPTSATYASQIYWMDWSGLNATLLNGQGSQPYTFTLADGSTLSLTLTRGGTSNATVAATAAPTFSGAAMGNAGYTGLGSAEVALYSAQSIGGTSDNPNDVSFQLSDIILTNSAGNPVQNFEVVMTDGESLDGGDGVNSKIIFSTSGSPWKMLEEVPASGRNAVNLTGLGTQTVTQSPGVSPTSVGILSTANAPATPFTVTADMFSRSQQGLMFGIRMGSISLNKKIVNRSNPADQFVYQILNSSGTSVGAGTGACAAVGDCTTSGSTTGDQIAISAAAPTGTTVTISEAMAGGSVSTLAAYNKSFVCENSNSGSPTILPAPGDFDPSNPPQITLQSAADNISCVISNDANADLQAVGAPAQTIRQNQPATVVTQCTNAGPQIASNASCVVTGVPGATTVCSPSSPQAALAVNGTLTCTTTFATPTPGTLTLVTTASSDTPDPRPSDNATTSTVLVSELTPLPDTGNAVSGTASTPIANVLLNDSVDGATATPQNSMLSVSTAASDPGVALNPETGAVTITSAVPPGTYAITYRLCNKAAPTVCADSSATVTVSGSASPQPDSGSGISGTASTAIANVLSNDAVDGVAATLLNSTLSVSTAASHPGVVLNPATGAVTITSAVPPGAYAITYRLCDKATPAVCAETSAAVTVSGFSAPQPDSGSGISGTASTPIENVLSNDSVDGVAATLLNSTLSVSSAASDPGVALNPATGAVTMTAAVPPGTYSITYRLCDKATPAVCADTGATVTVASPPPANVPVNSSWMLSLLGVLMALGTITMGSLKGRAR